MKIFIDTANTDEIREAASWGVLSGVTTNPSLIAKEGKEFKSVVKEITEIADASPSNIASISAEVLSDDAEGMIAEAHELVKIHDVITIKVPMTEEGIKAVSILSKEGIKTNVTLIFSPNQALLAARAGASYVSPFVGRMDDIANDGAGLVAEIAEIFDIYGIETYSRLLELCHEAAEDAASRPRSSPPASARRKTSWNARKQDRISRPSPMPSSRRCSSTR